MGPYEGLGEGKIDSKFNLGKRIFAPTNEIIILLTISNISATTEFEDVRPVWRTMMDMSKFSL